MNEAELYTPNLAQLSKKGISLTSFQPEPEAAGFLLFRTALECGQVSAPLSYYTAVHPGLGFLHLKSGALTFTAFPSEVPVTLSGESFLLFDCSYPYRTVIKTAAEYEIVHFSGNSVPYFRAHLLSDSPFRQDSHTILLLSESSLLFQKAVLDPILCNGLLTRLLTQIAMEAIPSSHTAPAWLTDLKEELNAQYYQKHTLEELERKYKVNRYRICREFKAYFGDSPMQYLHKMRMQAAKSLLLETDVKIHEISYEVGYENVNHFIHHFKKLTGATPTEYRNRLL